MPLSWIISPIQRLDVSLCSICMLKAIYWEARWGSVRVHLDPSVQEAGENHPTDLKTASVGSKGINVAECAVEKI